MGYSTVYAKMDRGNEGDDNTWFSIGVRPMYKWDQIMKTVAEVGYDDTDVWGTKEKLQKYTLAQAWSASSNIWARPEIRAYVTYAKSDNDNKFGTGKNDNYRNNECFKLKLGGGKSFKSMTKLPRMGAIFLSC